MLRYLDAVVHQVQQFYRHSLAFLAEQDGALVWEGEAVEGNALVGLLYGDDGPSVLLEPVDVLGQLRLRHALQRNPFLRGDRDASEIFLLETGVYIVLLNHPPSF